MIDKQIGDYKVLEYIGSGGMAKVYLAVHKEIPNLKVVLKVLSNPQHAERFKQEADKLALLDRNPNICKIRHFFNHGDEFVIAMEYIEGPSLEEIIVERGKIPIPDALKIILDILSALEPAHEQGIYHRDIKPSNIMFSKSGQVKIIDFGIAKGKSDPKLTVVGTAAGTPEYMAPEQFGASEDIDYARCDIYAVGTMLYKMVTGEMPFKGENEFLLRDAKMFNEATAPSKLNTEIDRDLDGIILTAIQCDPAKRFPTVAAMRESLEKVYSKCKNVIPEKKADREAAPVEISAAKGAPKGRIILSAAAVIIAAAVVLYMTGRLPFTQRGPSGAAVDTSAAEALVPGEAETGEPVQSGAQGVPGEAEKQAGEDQSSASSGGSAVKESSSDQTPPARQEAAEEKKPVTGSGSGAAKPAVKPAQGKIAIGSRPARAVVYINGVRQPQKTPYTFDLDPGEYSVRIVVSIGGAEKDYKKTVTVVSGSTVNVFWNAEE